MQHIDLCIVLLVAKIATHCFSLFIYFKVKGNKLLIIWCYCTTSTISEHRSYIAQLLLGLYFMLKVVFSIPNTEHGMWQFFFFIIIICNLIEQSSSFNVLFIKIQKQNTVTANEEFNSYYMVVAYWIFMSYQLVPVTLFFKYIYGYV